MKNILAAICLVFAVSFVAFAQTTAAPATETQTEKKKRAPVFRANKEQIKEAQTKLKAKNLYAGEITGKLDPDTRAGLKKYQEAESIRVTGTLNRLTLEKMGVALTDKQKAIPVPTYVDKEPKTTGEKKKRAPVFRASADQIMQAQMMLKQKGMFAGEAKGKLDTDTRTALKKFQEAEKIKVTGTLNRATLEKMGIALTEKQAEAAENK